MSTINKETMKDAERQVLTILEQDAKTKPDEITRRTGFSRQKVLRIIKRLEDENIIWGYVAITDGTKRNQKHFIALVKRSHGVPFDDSFRSEIAFDKIDNYPKGLIEVENIYYTHGSYDFVFCFSAPDLISAKQFINLSVNRFRKYISDYVLIETLFPIRREGIKNPNMKNLAKSM